MSQLRAAFDSVLAGRSLDANAAERAFGAILDGGDEAPEALVAGFLIALKMKGESAGELAGGALAMRARARKLDLNGGHVLDTAGTGGDGAGTFNISTGAALIAAAAGAMVAKHGNRAVTGRVGAADVLERLGVAIDCDPAGLARCLEAANICFIFAPAYHPVLARLGPLRRMLGTRTAFNLIAPLANPARPLRQLIGVADRRLFRPIAEALQTLGVEHAMVVHGEDGLDEISSGASTHVAEVKQGSGILEYQIAPEDFGIARANATALAASSADESIAHLKSALMGGEGASQDILALNAGAAIYVGGKAATIAAGVACAREVIASGRALSTLEKLRCASRGESR